MSQQNGLGSKMLNCMIKTNLDQFSDQNI